MKIRPFIIYSLLLCSLSFSWVSCSKLFNVPIDGETAFANKQYTKAAELLTEDYKAESDLLVQSEIAYKIAESYRLSNRPKDAERWYQTAVNYNSDPEVTFKYGLMLKANGDYKGAIATFKDYMLNNPTERAKAAKEIQASKQAMDWQNDTANYRLITLTNINSPASDFSPMLYENEQLVFTSARDDASGADAYAWTGEKHADLFVARKMGDYAVAPPVQFGDSINTDFNEGVITFSSDYKIAYFTGCGSPDEADDYCQIYVSFKNERNKWGEPQRLVLFESDTINVGQPFLTPDDQVLYFAADAPDGYGDKDIYRVKRTPDGLWSYPENLGPEINTDYYEGFPYIGPNGKLYFASKGHTGMGGLDIFVSSQNEKGKWSTPLNLKPPINSPADDFALIFEPTVRPELLDSVEAIGYFTSSRDGGVGNDDIYKFVQEVVIEPRPIINAPDPIASRPPIVQLEEPKTLIPELRPMPKVAPPKPESPIAQIEKKVDSLPPIAVATPKPKPLPAPPKPAPPKPVIPTAPKPVPPKPVIPVAPPKPVLTYKLNGQVLENVVANPNDPNSPIVSQRAIPSAVVEVLGLSLNSSVNKRIVTDGEGRFTAILEKDADYKVTAKQPQYFTQSKEVTTKGRVPKTGANEVEVYVELLLDKIYEQREIVLENIYYDLDKWNIRPDARPTLDKLAIVLDENPNIRIELGSHTDARGRDGYNQELSQKRAQSVVDYLASKSISRSRLVARGYGESRLVNDCRDGVNCSEEEHQQNRRTTFKVIGQ